MKLGVRNFLVVGLMALIFIVLVKVVFTKYPVKFVSEFVQSA
jgi:hypothetical protein